MLFLLLACADDDAAADDTGGAAGAAETLDWHVIDYDCGDGADTVEFVVEDVPVMGEHWIAIDEDYNSGSEAADVEGARWLRYDYFPGEDFNGIVLGEEVRVGGVDCAESPYQAAGRIVYATLAADS